MVQVEGVQREVGESAAQLCCTWLRLSPICLFVFLAVPLFLEQVVAEQRYRHLFETVDITRDFFFSYTLDITQPLQQLVQHEPVANGQVPRSTCDDRHAYSHPKPTSPLGVAYDRFVWNQYVCVCHPTQPRNLCWQWPCSRVRVRDNPCVWIVGVNGMDVSFLAQEALNVVQPDWFVPLLHGYFKQVRVWK